MGKLENKKVACIVVTYNRLQLLKRCLDGLRNQTCKCFDVIIVNNGCTDGTIEWLRGQGDLTVINQENLGGAGGFYSGMKKAFEDGYEWIWMMDDDGTPGKKQIQNLLEGAKFTNSKFVNALVCIDQMPEKLAFEISGAKMKIEAQKQRFIRNSIAPFNGTLIHRDVIRKIGFIKKEMFIWGDEVEYTLRAMQNGYDVYTITDAIHFHPAPKYNLSNVIPYVNLFKVAVPPKNRIKIKYRNLGYNSRYASVKGRVWRVFLYTLYYLFRFDIKGLIDFSRFYRMGYNNMYDI